MISDAGDLSVAIVVLSNGDVDLLERCLTSITDHIPPSLEVLVVDGSLGERVYLLLSRDYARFRYLRNPYGGSGSTEIALRTTTADIIVFLSEQVTLRPDTIAEMRASYADPVVAGVGARVAHRWTTEQRDTRGEIGMLLPNGSLSGNFGADPGRPIMVDHLAADAHSFRRDALQELAMSSAHRSAHGDWSPQSLSLRLALNGWRLVYNPNSCVDRIEPERSASTDPLMRSRYRAHRDQAALLGRTVGRSDPRFGRYLRMSASSACRLVYRGVKSAVRAKPDGPASATAHLREGVVSAVAVLAGAGVGLATTTGKREAPYRFSTDARRSMRLGAYLMAADPAWIEASVLSYYDIVEEIVVSYDRDGLSWTGSPIAVEECLTRLRNIDRDNKMRFVVGSFYRAGEYALDNDTHQRQCALAELDDRLDWVLQFDTDEVLPETEPLLDALAEAQDRGFTGVEFPARILYQYAGGNRFLERSGRFWQRVATYPGAIAVKPGASLKLCRQSDADLFRVDFTHHNTDPLHDRDAPVHSIVSPSNAILHYSWVRSNEHMRRKAASSGHAGDFDWEGAIDTWSWRRRHPFRAAAASPLRPPDKWNSVQWLRLSRIPESKYPDPTAMAERTRV